MLPENWKKEIVEAVNEADTRNAERHETQVARQNAIAAPLDSFADQFRRYASKQHKTEQTKGRRELAGIIGVYLSAFLVFITALIFYCQLRVFESTDKATRDSAAAARATLIASSRAWLAPRSASFTPIPKLHQPWRIIVTYGNVGKEPARGFVASQQFGSVDVPKKDENWFSVFPKAKLEDVCAKAIANDDGLTIYPSGPSDQGYIVDGDRDDFDITKEIVDGSKAAFIHGCFAYETLGEGPHKSEYCFVLIKDVDEKTGDIVYRSRHCMYGNKAT